jgi:hypothetical protein
MPLPTLPDSHGCPVSRALPRCRLIAHGAESRQLALDDRLLVAVRIR